jgi:hypothetical protein
MATAVKRKKQPIRLELGTLLLDNGMVHFEKDSYTVMNKDNKTDLLQCEM